jgi:3-methylcrotonyl-CoA carboxylase alpha subunit
MFINYEHEDQIYNVTVEKRKKFYYITYDNTEYKVEAEEIKNGHLKIELGDKVIKSVVTEGEKEKYVFVDGDIFKVKNIELTGIRKTKKKEKENNLKSPISGKVVNIKTKKGAKVKKGDILLVIEAMKMEYIIRAPYNGIIKKINFKEKDQIEIGQNTLELSKIDRDD